MARMRQAPRRLSHLSKTIRGYKGYSSSRSARETDQVFSEEILDRLSETLAIVSRLKRSASGSVDPEVLHNLDIITDGADRFAQHVADTVPTEDALLDSLENARVGEIEALDIAILEKVGRINQALSMMDLKGTAGMTSEDLDSVCELVDDLGNYLRRRGLLLAG